jgi:hypothetical protein
MSEIETDTETGAEGETEIESETEAEAETKTAIATAIATATEIKTDNPDAARQRFADRLALVTRMMRASERQVAEVERRIGTSGDEGDRDARMLAVIARTLRELTAIDALNRELTETVTAGARKIRDNNDEYGPQDIEALRQSIARKLEAIIAEREDPVSGEPDPC